MNAKISGVKALRKVRTSAAIVAARAAQLASRRLKKGGGSTVPGVVARRVDPGVLAALSRRLPLGSVAVTGTNGKTTTTRMTSTILRNAGVTVVSNASGANLVTGVTAALISGSSITGRTSARMGLFEIDEASVLRVAAEAELKLLAVLNLFRDQLDRYGELNYTASVIESGFKDLPVGGSVVLNADDPLVASLGHRAHRAVYFGVDEPALDMGKLQHIADSRGCPFCGAALSYETVYMGHVGTYGCPKGDFKRPEPAYRASRVRMDGLSGTEFLLSTPQGESKVRLSLPGLYNVYNALAAAAVAGEAGVGLESIVEGLEGFGGAFGRVERVKVGGKEVFLLLIKNPVGFNEILRTFITGGEAEDVLIAINDNDADGRDVSWLWDVDFEMLSEVHRDGRPYAVSGIRARDMAVRLKYAELPVGEVIPDCGEALGRALRATPEGGTLYVLPTYTAMLEIRRSLSDMGYTHPFWED